MVAVSGSWPCTCTAGCCTACCCCTADTVCGGLRIVDVYLYGCGREDAAAAVVAVEAATPITAGCIGGMRATGCVFIVRVFTVERKVCAGTVLCARGVDLNGACMAE